MITQTFDFTSKDGLKLSGQSWETATPKAVLCLVHGLGDHLLRHSFLAEYFCKHGIIVYAYDQRGHGKSEGKRGHTPSYEALMQDVDSMIQKIKKEYPELPLFLYGHSFGGNVAANFALRKGTGLLQGAIIASPWLRLAFEPPAFKLALGRMMSKIYPAYSDSNEINPDDISTDHEVVEQYKNDPLVHARITAKLFTETYEAGEWAMAHAQQLKIPALLSHGAEDKITDADASKEFAFSAPNFATFKRWEGMRHEPHNELAKEAVASFMLEWLDLQLKKKEEKVTS
jgi:acylglycerol lipase